MEFLRYVLTLLECYNILIPQLRLMLLALFPLVCAFLRGRFLDCFISLNSKEHRWNLHQKMPCLQTTDTSLSNLLFENRGQYFAKCKFTMKMLCASERCGSTTVKRRLRHAPLKWYFIRVAIISHTSFTSAFMWSFYACFVDSSGLLFYIFYKKVLGCYSLQIHPNILYCNFKMSNTFMEFYCIACLTFFVRCIKFPHATKLKCWKFLSSSATGIFSRGLSPLELVKSTIID
jgi:hypothetical protein